MGNVPIRNAGPEKDVAIIIAMGDHRRRRSPLPTPEFLREARERVGVAERPHVTVKRCDACVFRTISPLSRNG